MMYLHVCFETFHEAGEQDVLLTFIGHSNRLVVLLFDVPQLIAELLETDNNSICSNM